MSRGLVCAVALVAFAIAPSCALLAGCAGTELEPAVYAVDLAVCRSEDASSERDCIRGVRRRAGRYDGGADGQR